MTYFRSLLVANRGEIAIRVMRTAKRLGIKTIAVYSDADASAQHVKFADEAVHIGASAASDSYLAIDKIIDAAKQSGAEAIHPGYGFLSENAAFARAVTEADLTFVGPGAEAMDVMGDKARSKNAMLESGVPCIPGYQGDDQSDAELLEQGKLIGFPLMVKAAAGGGGKGMRLVVDAADLPNAITAARSEAERSFGSGYLIIERALQNPRHVEIQVFADNHGNTMHLGERDCSVQRRHQKVIEESPCPVMTPDLRRRMGEAAVKAAEAVSYRGAGTVEFMLDQAGEFYFLEMNTRLQVEHPVTEMVTGLDLVELQLKVAAGESLGLTSDDVSFDGHAIEVRLYAEDPNNNFLPSTGKVLAWRPSEGDGIRVDDGIATGDDVSPFYDPMIAKIIAHGADREEARGRLIEALKSTVYFGTKSNRDFLLDALQRESFATGEATTAFVGGAYPDGYSTPPMSPAQAAMAAVIDYTSRRRQSYIQTVSVNDELLNWSNSGSLRSVFSYRVGDEDLISTVTAVGREAYSVRVRENVFALEVVAFSEHEAVLKVDGQPATVRFLRTPDETLHLAFVNLTIAVRDNAPGDATSDESGGGTVTAPMHGMLLEVLVSEGDAVSKGTKIAVLEAMKMQHDIVAEIDGTVADIRTKAGSQIAAGDIILVIEEDAT